jgi:hypothetical protein
MLKVEANGSVLIVKTAIVAILGPVSCLGCRKLVSVGNVPMRTL